ncbi:hypothetical protein M8C21_033507, partial [Ambrosia artemisiifolia]
RPSSTRPPSAYNTPTTTITNPTRNPSYWDNIYTDIHTHLKKSIPIREPVTVFEPMHDLTFAPPIATASALCVAACELVGGQREDAIVAASAIHLMHATIYTHDNLVVSGRVGAISGSEPRSGSETLHRFGPNVELMTGDGIMPYGFELLAGSVIIEISRAGGAEGMKMINDGDEYEVEFDQWRGQRQLHGCGAACGAIMGGGTTEEIERLRRYGVYVGKIQGVLSGNVESEGVKKELVEKLRNLALKELECFDSKMVEQISSIV